MNIVIACDGGPSYPWAGCSFNDGIGGSEGCLIKLAEALAKKGHYVSVFNRCRERAGIWNKVEYMDFSVYPESTLPDTADLLISWRNWTLLLDKKAKVRCHSSHDIPVGVHHPALDEATAAQVIDKIVYLTPHHRARSSWWPANRCAIIPIGIEQDLDIFTRLSVLKEPTIGEVNVEFETSISSLERDSARVITFYHPNRGLHRLREIWPRVKAAVPEATLQSYWWQDEFLETFGSSEALGIKPMRRLGQTDLLIESLRSGVMAYPSCFDAEISPASTLVAQRGGLYPVCILKGGMVDTVQYGSRIFDDSLHAFAEMLIETLRRSVAGHLEDERRQMMIWASQFTWERAAQEWIALAGR